MNRRRSLLVVLFGVISPALFAARPEWKPVDPLELVMAQPLVDKDADAEVLEWEIRIGDDVTMFGESQSTRWHVMRVKVFTPRGKETQGNVEIPYAAGDVVSDVAGRTIRPDGPIVDLAPDAVFDKTLLKARQGKLKAKAFALSAVEPGAILEYRWRELLRNRLTIYEEVELQREIPIQKVSLLVKPVQAPGYTMRTAGFRTRVPPFEQEKGGYFRTTIRNVPILRDEPHMPPHGAVGQWLLIYYIRVDRSEGDEFWNEWSKSLHEEFLSRSKPNGDVKKAAAGAAQGSASPEETLGRLFDLCRTRIRNESWTKSDPPESGKSKKRKPAKSAGDTLSRGEGTTFEINMLFAALARAAGFDVRATSLPDRAQSGFERTLTDGYLLRGLAVAVRVGEEWRYFSPGYGPAPLGMLYWGYEGQEALLSDPKPAAPTWVKTPLSPPDRSRRSRTATMTLDAEGTLEGDVRLESTGHAAADERAAAIRTGEDREKPYKEAVQERLPGAEVTQLSFETPQDARAPAVTRYHVRVPGFAAIAGSRLVVKPAFFQAGLSPRFPAADRTHPVFFAFPWSEADDVTLRLPEGFGVDALPELAPFTAEGLARYESSLVPSADGRTLRFRRSFEMSKVLLESYRYRQVKALFDRLHDRDAQQVVLKAAAR